MLCRFCFSHRNFGCFDLVCLIVPSTFVIFPIGITVICNIICLWMGNLYAATPGQNPGVARIYMSRYIYYIINIQYTLVNIPRHPHVLSIVSWSTSPHSGQSGNAVGGRGEERIALQVDLGIFRPGSQDPWWLMMVNDGKWWLIVWLVVFRHPSEKYEFVSWDDDIPNWMEK